VAKRRVETMRLGGVLHQKNLVFNVLYLGEGTYTYGKRFVSPSFVDINKVIVDFGGEVTIS
jgi:hypothetical protein